VLRVIVGTVFAIATYVGALAFVQAPELNAVRRLGR
jgi:hypothetical protein